MDPVEDFIVIDGGSHPLVFVRDQGSVDENTEGRN
jgi:hypothetical protein